jgi:hypothetical protein
MKNMKLRNQILIVNAAVLAGLGFVYFQGSPLTIIIGCGIFLLLLVNAIFFFRMRRLKNHP